MFLFSQSYLFQPIDCHPDGDAGAVLPGIPEVVGISISKLTSVCCDPGKSMSFEEFCATTPPFSIALDGYVDGPPMEDHKGERRNSDHHRGVPRMETLVTCEQVFEAIRNGELFTSKSYQSDSTPITIYVNDPDLDVALSVWLIDHQDLVSSLSQSHPLIGLVKLEGLMDKFAGATPINTDSILVQTMAWINEPYMEARSSGELNTMTGSEMVTLIQKTGERISQFVEQGGEQVELDTKYSKVTSGQNWIMYNEASGFGDYARIGLAREGWDVIVSHRLIGNGRSQFSIIFRTEPAKPIEGLARVFNTIEQSSSGSWGGGDRILASPRRYGTKISVEDFSGMISGWLQTV